ncbi:virion protein US10 [Testudinid alphaherpesvirus 3]|uniref:US 10 protein n=1 Tax=Testudinid alphaherpesvirus 3 TaxID=2560801 RepID=A0A0K1R179_9ALPH|nr:virion protein US10 [Testudinid alphaherpesvirus 3]AIU39309.1 virion protein US10 [Testudinid alphaherpesvirus 3]AIU39419.1 virion protein US10 [Testudinid alphaherpesvirus 3]AKI81695.1 virion protein US10 [Testudinid alphaherpesvirus 3]AKI81798.1 virion protein US10 [Testudinid alphaherpesvirus 3]AKV40663.1 US 10 protein [Testudinid alphaherpesvirus 3]
MAQPKVSMPAEESDYCDMAIPVLSRAQSIRRPKRETVMRDALKASPYILLKILSPELEEHIRSLPDDMRDFWRGLWEVSRWFETSRLDSDASLPEMAISIPLRFGALYDSFISNPDPRQLGTHAMRVMLGKLILNTRVTDLNTPSSHMEWGKLLIRMSYWCCLSHDGTCALSSLYGVAATELYSGFMGVCPSISSTKSAYWEHIIALVKSLGDDRDFGMLMKDIIRACMTAGVPVPAHSTCIHLLNKK